MNKISFNIVFCIAVFHLLSFSSASKILPRSFPGRKLTMFCPEWRANALVFGGDQESCVCGGGKQSRIFGGQEAYPAEFPWMVRIYMFERHLCGGSLITRRHVLTAAHCLRQFPLAEHDETVVETMDGNTRYIETVYLHESFDRKLHNNDIAIVKLSSPVSLGDSVQTICLPQYQYFYNQNQWGTVNGWGFTEFGGLSDRLLKISVELMSNQECVENSSWKQEGITENMFCAFGDENKDACTGDSGGPLQVRNEKGAIEIAGIVSKGNGSICGDREYPGVYTDVYRYLNWINYYISGEDLCRLPN